VIIAEDIVAWISDYKHNIAPAVEVILFANSQLQEINI
jgi:hypothetical protein